MCIYTCMNIHTMCIYCEWLHPGPGHQCPADAVCAAGVYIRICVYMYIPMCICIYIYIYICVWLG